MLLLLTPSKFGLRLGEVTQNLLPFGFETTSGKPVIRIDGRDRELWKVEAIFRTTKAVLQARPVYHSSDAAIRGHLFCRFLALIVRKEVQDRLDRSGTKAEWCDIVRDLKRG